MKESRVDELKVKNFTFTGRFNVNAGKHTRNGSVVGLARAFMTHNGAFKKQIRNSVQRPGQLPEI